MDYGRSCCNWMLCYNLVKVQRQLSLNPKNGKSTSKMQKPIQKQTLCRHSADCVDRNTNAAVNNLFRWRFTNRYVDEDTNRAR